jgi:hypothetical protein
MMADDDPDGASNNSGLVLLLPNLLRIDSHDPDRLSASKSLDEVVLLRNCLDESFDRRDDDTVDDDDTSWNMTIDA